MEHCRNKMADLLNFQWVRYLDGYDVCSREPLGVRGAFGPSGITIAPRDGREESYAPLETNPALYREFAALPESPDALIGFVEAYGPLQHLTWIGKRNAPATPQPFDIGPWLDAQRLLQDFVKQWEAGSFQPKRFNEYMQTPLDQLALFPDLRKIPGRASPAFCIRPTSLWAALYLQFAIAAAEDTKPRKCAQCPRWFAVGPNHGRKTSAIYCSDRCRVAAYRQRQKEAIQ